MKFANYFFFAGYEVNFGERFRKMANSLFNFVPFNLIFLE